MEVVWTPTMTSWISRIPMPDQHPKITIVQSLDFSWNIQDGTHTSVLDTTIHSRAFDSTFRSKKRACPVPGCRNQRVAMDPQLEEDYEFELKIKRSHSKRMETEKRMRLTQLKT